MHATILTGRLETGVYSITEAVIKHLLPATIGNDRIHAIEHCIAIDLVLHKGKKKEKCNIGRQNEISNIQLANRICDTSDILYPVSANGLIKQKSLKTRSYKDLISFVDNRLEYNKRYAMNIKVLE